MWLFRYLSRNTESQLANTDCLVSNRVGIFGTLRMGRANMRHVFQPELLAALKDSLHNLENLKTLSPNEVEIVRLKRFLRHVGSGNSEPLIPEILTRSEFKGKVSSKLR